MTTEDDATTPILANSETLEIAFNESTQALLSAMARTDAIDSKVVSVFGVGSVVISLVPIFKAAPLTGHAGDLWIAALLAWATSAMFCLLAYKPRTWRFGPDPNIIADPAWLRLPPDGYRSERLKNLGKTYAYNQAISRKKSEHLRWAMIATAVEVSALAVALIFG